MWKFCAFLLPLPLSAATPGIWEPFSTETNAGAWGLYDFLNQATSYPEWFDDGEAGENADPYAGAIFLNDPDAADEPILYNQPYLIFADEFVGDGDFVGDFHASQIAGMEVDVLITFPELLESCDLTFISNSGGETITYYSDFFAGDSFPDPVNWTTLSVTFDQQWFIFDEELQEYFEVEITDEVLGDVVEVGIRFFPTATNQTVWAPGIDNFALTPTIIAPVPVPDFVDGKFVMTYEATPGNRYLIEEFNVATESWEDFAGESETTQSGTSQTFETSVAPGKALLRISAEPDYQEVFSTGIAPGP